MNILINLQIYKVIVKILTLLTYVTSFNILIYTKYRLKLYTKFNWGPEK